ncbi:MAG: type III pantothenate kinase [Gammaproteobacteria bacterium]
MSRTTAPLLIDCGNSRLKWAHAASDAWRSQAVPYIAASLRDVAQRAFADAPPPESIWVSCVAGESTCAALAHFLSQRFGVAPKFVRATASAAGVHNRYTRPEQLGADRWVALVGARALTSAACAVIDCGTAVTVDALNAKGEFVGGVIFPGLRLARASLAQATSALDTAPGSGESCLARSTADAIAAGTRYGIAGAIERVVREFEATLGPLEWIATGGDAPQVLPLLSAAARHEPDLVLKGLARLAAP